MKIKINNYSLIPVTAFIFLVSVISACKKDHPTVSQLTQIDVHANGNITTTGIQYNTDGTVMAFNSTGTDATNALFAYPDNHTVLIRKYVAATNTYKGLDSLTLNSAGYLINDRAFATYKTDWINEHYELNASNEIQSSLHTSSGGASFPNTSYTYLGGNLVQDNLFKYTYDLAKPAMPGDYFSVQDLLNYGLSTMRSKNLVTGAVAGQDTTAYKYTFDSAGHISQLQLVSKGKTNVQYNFTYTNN